MSSAAPMQQAKTEALAKTTDRSIQLAPQSDLMGATEHADLRNQASSQRKLQSAANHSQQSHQFKAMQQVAQANARATQLKSISAMMKTPSVQRVEDEEALQAKSIGAPVQREASTDASQTPKPNNTGLPDHLKSGIESLSGMSMDHVKVHYNSPQPAQLNAHAYAQGSDIHVAPGQEQHLPHEAWHVVQQAQGRVKPTMQMKSGVPVNDDAGLEAEADVMGAKAIQFQSHITPPNKSNEASLNIPSVSSKSIQRRTLAQAGQHNGMVEIADQAIIGGDVGPTLGSAYIAPIGEQENKTAALSAAGAAYAGFVADKPVAGLLSRTNICEVLNTAREPISNYIAGLNGNAATTTGDAATHIKTNIIRPLINPAFKTDVGDDELTAILTAMRAPITKNPANKFFANPLPAGPLTNYVKGRINATWRANANVPPIDPFLYRAQGTIDDENFSVSFQHSHDWPGYVTHIQDGGAAASMRLNGAIQNPNDAGIPDQFGRKHHETGNDNLANDLTLNALDPRVDNERRLDSMTKLAGEGARFICVRNNLAIMTDKSRFYVIGADQTKYVTLEDLWSSWSTGFGKRNNISIADVRAEIVGGNVWTYNHQDRQPARVFNDQADPAMGGADVNLT
jgi:hypothetical protein